MPEETYSQEEVDALLEEAKDDDWNEAYNAGWKGAKTSGYAQERPVEFDEDEVIEEAPVTQENIDRLKQAHADAGYPPFGAIADARREAINKQWGQAEATEAAKIEAERVVDVEAAQAALPGLKEQKAALQAQFDASTNHVEKRKILDQMWPLAEKIDLTETE